MASYTYACKDYPGMDSCPGTFESQAQDELWKHIELHAAAAPRKTLPLGHLTRSQLLKP